MFTKAEVAKMPAEQQEELAKIVLSKFRQREQLVKVVRGRDWRSRCFPIIAYIPCLIILILMWCRFFNSKEMSYVICALNGSILFASLIYGLHAHNNRRLDALLELLDFDNENQSDSNHSKDEKIG
jgi:hypothetical protein